MKTKLIENNSNDLVVFLTGWGCDDNQFKNFSSSKNLLLCWDYCTLDFEFDFSKYNKVSLLTYSAGVLTACLLQDKFPEFDKKVAVNGNPLMTDKKFGISKKIIDLMLNLNLDNCMDFISTYLVHDEQEMKKFLSTPSYRPFESSKQELIKLQEYCNLKFKPVDFDKVILSDNDKVFNPATQQEYFKGNFVLLKNASHHTPFLRFSSVDEIFNL
ncbi:MAG: DUF452 family protein [Elusimicrobia bacterium]|nr:DUF452 family protein [Elusimicrobiota bacterium]